MDIEKVAWFFDGGIFGLMALTGYMTVFVVWIESRLLGQGLSRTQWAIILRSAAFAALFTFIFTDYFWDVPRNRAFLWSFRSFLATAMINYLICLILNVRSRHNLSFKELFTFAFSRFPRSVRFRR